MLQPLAALLCCFTLVLLVPVALYLSTYIFRVACHLAGLPRPGVLATTGKMFISAVGVALVMAILNVAIMAAGDAAGVPRWESEFVSFGILFLPVDLVISCGVHAGVMRIPFGKAVEVWFVRRLIQLAALLCVLAVAALVYYFT